MRVEFMFRVQRERVELNEMVSNEVDVTVEVLQESILGPLLFLIYINDPALVLLLMVNYLQATHSCSLLHKT